MSEKSSNQNESRPTIPAAVARRVRQECYFGCVLCGSPVFHYDHIEEYADVKEHKAENLALLCANHHNDKTTKKLTAERVKDAKLKPFNKGRYLTAGHQLVDSKTLSVDIGGNKVLPDLPVDGQFFAVYVNGKNYLSIHSDGGWLLPTIMITDEAGLGVLRIDKGEIQVATTALDYTYIGNRLTIKDMKGETIVDLILSNETLKVIKAKFFDGTGTGFIVKNGVLTAYANGKPTTAFQGNTAGRCKGGWAIWDKTQFPDVLPPNGFGFAKIF